MAEQIDSKSANKALIITGIVIALFVVGLITNGFGLFNHSTTIQNNSTDFVPLSIGNAPVLGDKSAPVTVYEFSDFSCPFCSAAAGYNQPTADALRAQHPGWEPAIKMLKDTYVAEGKVKLVFKYATGHGTGQAAHNVAWCLNDQGLFWKFHDKAFENQEDTGNTEKMKSLAQDIRANMTQLNECLTSGKYNNQFQLDEEMGTSNGVRGTPAFFVNGKLISGAIPWSDLKAAIDKELGQ
ncbi:DsbA family protein [Candidatus Pacearchaeota archaeon]|nr:DsbA family protein [Candidatus Pacearchaeota archaeon]